MAERRDTCSTMLSSMPSVPSTFSRVNPSPVSIWRETTLSAAVSAAAISSRVSPISSEISLRVGSRPSTVWSLPRAMRMLPARSLMPRLTFTVPSSRRNRRISPAILGTA